MLFSSRNLWLTQNENDLLKECRIDLFRGSGNGGQKRNKTDSAIRLNHTPSKQKASSDATRSQHQNKHLACRLLKIQIALNCRVEDPIIPPDLQWAPALDNDNSYALWLAIIFDQLNLHSWNPSPVAILFNKSTSALVKALARDTTVWQFINIQRQLNHLSPLHHS